MVKILSSNKSINYFILLIIMLAFWAYRFIYNPIWIEEHGFLENLVYQYFNPQTIKIISPIIAAILILLFSFYLISANTQIIIFPKAYQVIGVFFVIFSGFWINAQKATPELFATIFLYLAIFQMYKTYKLENVAIKFFDIGFLYGISLAINTYYIFFLPIVILSTFIIKKISPKEIISLILGIMTIIIIVLLLFFFFGDINTYIDYYKNSIINLFTANTHKEKFLLFLFPQIIITLFVFTYSFFIKQSSLFTKKVNFILLLFTFVSVIFIMLPGNSIESTVVLFVPLAFLSSNIFVSLGNKTKTVFYYSIILLTIFSQFLQINLIFSK